MVLDSGSKNMDLTQDLIQRYGIKGTIIAPYHPQANGLVERGHQGIIDALAKYATGPTDWAKYLPLALWADRITTRRSTGYTPFELVYGRDCLLPIQLSVDSWSTVDWGNVTSREELILARMRQLDQCRVAEEQAADNLRNSRKQNKAYFDSRGCMRTAGQEIDTGDLVLAFDVSRGMSSRSRKYKLDDR
jgi:hypothetical protein